MGPMSGLIFLKSGSLVWREKLQVHYERFTSTLQCMGFRVPALDQSDCSICYNYDLILNYVCTKQKLLLVTSLETN